MKQARVRTESMVQRYAKKPISEGYDLWDRDYPLGALRLFTFKAETAPPFQLAPCLDATAEIALQMNGLEDAREQFLLAMDKYKLLQQALLSELMRIKVVEIDRGASAALRELRALLASVDPQADGSGAAGPHPIAATAATSSSVSSSSSGNHTMITTTTSSQQQQQQPPATAVMPAGARRQTSLARCYAYLAELLLDTMKDEDDDEEEEGEEGSHRNENEGEEEQQRKAKVTAGGNEEGNHRYYEDGETRKDSSAAGDDVKARHEAECAQTATNDHAASATEPQSRAESIAQAIQYASLAVKLGWDRVHTGYIALGDAYVEGERWGEAHAAYAQALQRCPRCVAALEKQLEVVRHLMQSAHDSSSNNNNDMNSNLLQGELLQLLDRALEVHPRAELMREKAFLLCETANEAAALAYLDACLAQPPLEEIESVESARTKTLATLLKAKAAILADAERFAEALHAARAAVEANPRDADASRLVAEISALIK